MHLHCLAGLGGRPRSFFQVIVLEPGVSFDIGVGINLRRRARRALHDVEKIHFDAARRLLSPGLSGRRIQLPHGIEIAREGASLIVRERPLASPISRPVSIVPGEGRWPLPGWGLVMRVQGIDFGGASAAADDRRAVVARLRFPLTVRPRRPGDRLRPFGMSGTRRLGRIMIDRKVPLSRRDTIPVVEDRGGILWVPGVVAAERTRVRTDAATAFEILIEPGR